MAGVVDHDTAAGIKKELEDVAESPEQTDAQDSPQNQSEANGSQKQSKVWSEDETRSMIELHKTYLHRFKDGNYSKKQLLEDVAQELNLIGYDTTPDKVRNKMKYLRTRYKGILHYNAKHVSQKEIPFHEELTELYTMESYEDQEPSLSKEINGNESSDVSFTSNSSEKPSKRTKLIPASHVDLQSVVTKKKSNVSKAKVMKRKMPPKRSGQPLYQCGLCMTKFRTSSDMHDHRCKTPTANSSIKKKAAPNSTQQSFHWNSLITMQFLDLLKEYQDSHKNSNFRKGNIWENMSCLMKRMGNKIPAKELSKKWNALSTAFEKTIAYNSTHKDKKKCAFFKRLMDLHNHPASFNCFKDRYHSPKRTVEVSPFSFSLGPSVNSKQSAPNSNHKVIKEEKQKQSNMSDLISWLNSTWTEYKEMERQRQELECQRHNEIMEMVSFLIDSKDKHH